MAINELRIGNNEGGIKMSEVMTDLIQTSTPTTFDPGLLGENLKEERTRFKTALERIEWANRRRGFTAQDFQLKYTDRGMSQGAIIANLEKEKIRFQNALARIEESVHRANLRQENTG